jgi:hypothetical protein
MTWKRRLAVISLFVVLVGIGVGLAMMLTPDHRPGVTKANFDKLQEGMSIEQVETWLGADSRRLFGFGRSGLGASTFNQTWIADDGARAAITFSLQYGVDEDWKVASMTWTDSTETTWQRIRRWLRIPA